MQVHRAEELRSMHWPTEDLEFINQCPICGSVSRELMHDGLWDSSALAAPGQWSLWRCSSCRSAYLDPRPTTESIGRAYEAYYTHEEQPAGAAPAPTKFIRHLKSKLANGYRDSRFGTNSPHSSKIGAYLGAALPSLRRASDFWYRYLPRSARDNPKVLDVGCGGGQWLSSIADTRWEGFGSDPDARAIDLAASSGLNVRRGGIEVWNDMEGNFDALTLSHVIEHVHDPRELLLSASHLLRAGGQLYVETPNIDALGHSLFGRSWRGLEAPRHLVLFTRASLTRLLRETGFTHIRQQLAPSQFGFITNVSNELQRIDPEYLGQDAKEPNMWMRLRSRYTRSRREFLTFTAIKPRGAPEVAYLP